MKKKQQIMIAVGALVVLAALVLVFNPFGNSAGDVLATYVTKDGKVHELTRGEIYEAFGANKDRILEDKQYQKNFIENMLYQKLQAVDAVALGMHTNAQFIKQTNDQVQNSMLIQELLATKFPREKFEFSLEGRRVRMILLKRDLFRTVEEPDPNRFARMEQVKKTITNETKLSQELARLEKAVVKKPVKRTEAELAALDKDIADRLAAVVADLKKSGGKDFAELAKKYSEHESATNGGAIGIMLPRQRNYSPLLVRAVYGLKAGEQTQAIRTAEGFAIARLDEIVTVENDNLSKYFKDEAQVNRAKDDAWYAAVWTLIDEISTDDLNKQVFISRDKLASTDTNSVIFEIRSDRFKSKMTLGELVAKAAGMPPFAYARYGILREENSKAALTPEELGLIYDWEISIPILKYGAYRSGIVESKKFRAKLAQVADSLLARQISEQKRNSVNVTDKDIEEQYEKNTKSYVKRTQTGTDAAGTPVFQTQQLSLADAREQIRNELQGKRVNELFTNWKKELFTKFQAKINEKKFEVKKKPEPKKPEAAQKKPEAPKVNGTDAKKNNGK